MSRETRNFALIIGMSIATIMISIFADRRLSKIEDDIHWIQNIQISRATALDDVNARIEEVEQRTSLLSDALVDLLKSIKDLIQVELEGNKRGVPTSPK